MKMLAVYDASGLRGSIMSRSTTLRTKGSLDLSFSVYLIPTVMVISQFFMAALMVMSLGYAMHSMSIRVP